MSEGSSYVRRDQPSFILFLGRLFSFPSTLCNTQASVTRSLKLIFCVLLQAAFQNLQGIPDIFFRVVQFVGPYKSSIFYLWNRKNDIIVRKTTILNCVKSFYVSPNIPKFSTICTLKFLRLLLVILHSVE